MIQVIAEAEARIHNSHARRLTAELRRHAWQSGWPTATARQLLVVQEDGDYRVEYPTEIADEVEDLEFGSLDIPATYVLRRFVNRLDQHSQPVTREFSELIESLEIL